MYNYSSVIFDMSWYGLHMLFMESPEKQNRRPEYSAQALWGIGVSERQYPSLSAMTPAHTVCNVDS